MLWLLALSPQVLSAQESELDSVELEPIKVTGSRIRRSEGAAAFPLVTLDREAIERSGASTVTELIKDVIYNTSGVRDETYTQGFAPASAAVDLRGLGPNRTLVLLDGRRLPVFPFARDGGASFVDINLIPLAAIERVEIYKDGASAVYGSDAIAGVVNLVTRRGYDGAELTLDLGTTERGDGDTGHFSAIGGFTTDRANITVGLDHYDRSKVMARDRDLSASANGPFDDRSAAGDPGTQIILPSGRPMPDPDCPTDSIDPDTGFCLYDFAPFVTLIPPVQRTSLFASADYALGDGLTAFIDGYYAWTDSQRDLAPASGGFIVSSENDNNPLGEDVFAVYRLSELGPRRDTFETEAWNLVGGLQGHAGRWDWELGVGGGEIATRIRGVNGYATADAVESAIADGSLNPFGDSPNFDPDSLTYTTRRDGHSRLFYTDLEVTGSLLELPHGPLALAVGTEYRSESFSDRWDPLTEAGAVLGVGGTSSSGDRDTFAFYAELNVPILPTLELDLAARYDDYSDFGNTFNPKLGIRWAVRPGLLLRASAGTGFKAPSLPELNSGEISGFAGVFDPTIGEVVQVDTIASGNPSLDAESSNNYGLGLVWDVRDNWSLTADWWRIDLEDAVSNDAQFYVDNEASLPGTVVRDEDGMITLIRNPFQNIAERRTWGLDLGSRSVWDLGAVGDLGLSIDATYLGAFEEKALPGAASENLAGKNGRPRWRGQAVLTWERAALGAALTVNAIGPYDRKLDNLPDDRVGSWTTVDAQFDWRLPRMQGSTLTIGAENLFDEAPPEDAFLEGWPFFNRDLYSARGRFVYARYTYRF